MGRHIDCENPRRLWLTDDIGSKNIEAILLHPQREQKHIEIAIEAFREMRKLRLLEVHNVWTPRVPEYLSSQLRWLIWEKFPSESLPPRFEADNLVGLQLNYSSIERPWRGEKRTQQEDSTRSLVLLSVSGLHSLEYLDVSGCNMFDGAIPSDLEPMCSLKRLYLNGNYFTNIPSLSQLSLLSYLCLDDCKMLDALPELPSSIKELSADDCPSLRLFADQFTNSHKVHHVSFRNCLQLLKEAANGESKNIANTLWQHMIQRSRVETRLLSILLPGREIPEWFCKQTTGTSILLKLPPSWSHDNFMGYGFCVAFYPTHRAFFGRQKNVVGVLAEITVRRTCSNREYRLSVLPDYITRKNQNIGMEHVCLVYLPCFRDRNDWCEIEVSIKNLSPNTVVVTKWGMGLVPKFQGVYIEPYDKDDDDVV
ncbi:hypothetical protein LguiA_029675 [Lonicera macranthoides]